MQPEPLVIDVTPELNNTITVTIKEAPSSSLIPPTKSTGPMTMVHPDAICEAVQEAVLNHPSPVHCVRVRFSDELAKDNAGWDFKIQPDGRAKMIDAIPPQTPPVFSISEMRNDPGFPPSFVDQTEALCLIAFMLCFGNAFFSRPSPAEGSD